MPLWTLYINVWVPIFNSLVYAPMSGIVGLYVLCLIFLKSLTPPSIEAALPHILTSNAQSSQFLHIFTNTSYFLFGNSHLRYGKVGSRCSIDLHFPNESWSWTNFPVLTGHSYVFFGDRPIQDLLTTGSILQSAACLLFQCLVSLWVSFHFPGNVFYPIFLAPPASFPTIVEVLRLRFFILILILHTSPTQGISWLG